jgi:hypothetical protein
MLSSRVLMQRALIRRSLVVAPRQYATTTTASVLPMLTTIGAQSHGATSTDDTTHWRFLAMAAGAFAAASMGLNSNNTVDCCGIAGVVASDQHDARYVACTLVLASRLWDQRDRRWLAHHLVVGELSKLG